MEDCDFERVYDSYKQLSIDRLYERIRNTVRRQNTLEAKLQSVGQTITGLLPCITDEYSRLRYSLYFLQKLRNGIQEKISYVEKNRITRSSVQEMYFSVCMQNGKNAEDLLREYHDLLEYTSILRNIARTRVQVSVQDLLEQVGNSDYVDSFIGDIFRNQIPQQEFQEVEQNFRHKILDRKLKPKITTWLLDIAAYHKMRLLTEHDIEVLFQRLEGNVQGTLALLRYVGECGLLNLIPLLHRKLQRSMHQPIAVKFGIIDVLGQIGDKRSLQPLSKLRDDVAGLSKEFQSTLLRDYIDLATREIGQNKGRHDRIKKGGICLVQCIFYGDVDLPGISGGGGIATLLHELGNQLAQMERWDRVVSFVLFPLMEGVKYRPLIQPLGNSRHCIVRVPVTFPQEDHARQFMLREYEIHRSLRRALEMHCIDPDIFHVRYSDNASKAVMLLSKGLDKKLVFTLTTDPHRSFVDRKGKMRSMTEDEVLLNLNKVYIADLLVEEADGIVLIGQGRKNDQIIPYFPKLWLEPEIRQKPIRVIPEGIRIHVRFSRDESANRYIDLLLNHKGKHRLHTQYLSRPVILNVGRLNPVKNQHLLVEVWARSKINELYNLVLIGGNLEQPDNVEQELLKCIDVTLENFAYLEGRFCHLKAMPNRDVRLFQKSIIEKIQVNLPNVYLSSSLKEEFGISIIEAMTAGFLIIAPLSGGVSSYIQNGKNGFLIDTHSADEMKRGIESIFLLSDLSPEKLYSIARSGTRITSQIFDIKHVAKIFSDYYGELFYNTMRPSSKEVKDP